MTLRKISALRSLHFAPALLVACQALALAEPSLDAILERHRPLEPEESLASFRVEAGFRVEMAAAEPNVCDPVDMAWDEDGRLYVCELWNYPGVPQAGEKLGRVRRLESSHGDGVYDRSVVFADQLRWPGGIYPWQGGVFVISSPDVWYLKDTKGDGHVDVRRKVLTGLKGGTYEIGNSLRWGLDNRIYLSGSYAGGEMAAVTEGSEPHGGVRSRDFAFDPRTLAVDGVSGYGEFGQSFTEWGERVSCDATHLTWHAVLPRQELARNPYLAIASVTECSIPEWTHIFPISPAEPWKVARQKFWSRWVNTNQDMKAGRFPDKELAPHGFATAAAGITVYRGSIFGPDYEGDAFLGEPANNVVVRLKLREDGVSLVSERPKKDLDEQREFLASTDNWFRPVNLANGPDGCLYVAAMYREIIEDESAIPADILAHYDLFTGRDRGRILRIAPEGFHPPAAPRLSAAGSAELVQALGSRESWWRDTAQRLLYERQDKSVIPALQSLARESQLPQVRIQALWTLHGLDALSEDAVATALGDVDGHVREQALALSEPLLAGSSMLRSRVIALAADALPRVRFRAAFALGYVKEPEAIAALAEIARKNPDDQWLRSAVLSAVANRSGDLLRTFLLEPAFATSAGGRKICGLLAEIAGTRDDAEEMKRVAGLVFGKDAAASPELQRTLLRQLADGLNRAGHSLGEYVSAGHAADSSALTMLFVQAQETLADAKKHEPERVEAMQLLAHAPFETVSKICSEYLDPAQPVALQLAAVRTLSSQNDPSVAEMLIGRWGSFAPAVRPDVVDALFRRPERQGALFAAVESGKIPQVDLEPRRREALLHHQDAVLRARAERVFVTPKTVGKNELIARYQREVLPLSGDPKRGEKVFSDTCAVCHRAINGIRVGPNLATLEDRSPGTLLVAILDPNREVKPSYVSYDLTTTDGQSLSGVISAETATSVTLRRAGGGDDTILRSKIKSLQSLGISLMPEGLEGVLDAQKMADLLSFLPTFKE